MGAEFRKAARRQVSQPALMLNDDGSIIGLCTMLDVSAGGCRIKLAAGIVAPPEFTRLLSKFNAGMRRRCTIAWQNTQQLGLRFLPVSVSRKQPRRGAGLRDFLDYCCCGAVVGGAGLIGAGAAGGALRSIIGADGLVCAVC